MTSFEEQRRAAGLAQMQQGGVGIFGNTGNQLAGISGGFLAGIGAAAHIPDSWARGLFIQKMQDDVNEHLSDWDK